ncbi:MAG: extensin family protein [Alphaproteobacteria bacterium]|nr:MAG: extensin family protein [Alphaproteobacteria bacterium]
MKKSHSLIALGAGLMIVLSAGLLLANWRMAEAANGQVRFARPNYDAARAGAVIDLQKYGALGDVKRLAGLSADLGSCHDALAAAGVDYTIQPAQHEGACGYNEAVVVEASMSQWKAPKDMAMTCDLAAKMHLWERHIVIPAAEKILGSPVKEIKAFGTFQCRRVAGHARLSAHAFAKAVDVAGFVLEDGREISVLKDFRNKGPKGDFLREVHDRACGLFDVTLGPDYNADHANHFHLDVGGQYSCR